ncbi:RNA-directed DNA polymerase [Pseudomonas sp. LRF_L74]|uniref:RNA-directed DNA polymerase n=1 Tax=Pseudomonas sp. LRF_L74 TaxID=3369422 RepID=UPI003F637726
MQAYHDCRRNKRTRASALAFEFNLERNIMQLHHDLNTGAYRPGASSCFVVTHPKHREVWAADFPDRIAHHLLYNHVGPRIERTFIADSCACIPGRGTLYAAQRLEKKVRSITQNWRRPAAYIKCDLANFFVTIDKRVLAEQLRQAIPEQPWQALALQILWHDPRENYQLRSPARLLNRVPQHKRLTSQPAYLGLPIGNLSSQFYANIYLNALDQFVKHQLRARHYIRYVDDIVLLHESPEQLNEWHDQIEAFLAARLHARLNPSKTIRQPVDRGIDFVGQVILPHRRITRRRTVDNALRAAANTPAEGLRETANSHFGLLRQASHSQKDRRQLTKALLLRGRAVDRAMTKVVGGAA